jgi:two-component system nitrate/nitrite sensor histidine kinase NarX
MHDSLAQTVSLLGLQIDEAMELISKGSEQEAVEGLTMTRETVKQVSTDVRRSIASLQRTPRPRRSLQSLLADLPRQLSIENMNLIDFVFKIQEPLFLPQDQSDQALFVIQEALLNAYRHAKAQHIEIILDQQERELIITVRDDGVGFELGEWWRNSRDHFGLGIMHSRAANIGAKLQVTSSPGQGTRVTLTLSIMDGKRGWVTPTASWETTSQTLVN